MEALASVPTVAMVTVSNDCHGSTNNVAIRHFRASSVAILEFMATYLHKNGCHDQISLKKRSEHC